MRSKGYTLIETLLVLTIIALLFGVGYANYRQFSRRQALLGVAKVVQGDLRQAQQYALSGVKPDLGCSTLDGIAFRILDDKNSYSVDYVCNGVDIGIIKTETLSSDISISSTLNPIVFRVLGLGTNIESSGSAVITLTQGGTNNNLSITIGSSGDIK